MYDLYQPYRRTQTIGPLFLLVFPILFAILVGIQFARGVPAITSTTTFAESSRLGEARPVTMPATGAFTVAVDGVGGLGSSGPPGARPIASLTKMMTAHVILKNHPLRIGEIGPTVPITATDARRYQEMIAEDQSAVPVLAGTSMTQLQLLQGLLIPSANNYAEILANWDAGSVASFVAKMNAEAQALGMTQTSYADASGFSARSMSTAQDQLTLARVAMQNPVFAATVGMPTTTLPGAGVQSNVNQLLGQEGVIGIKTGFTEEAGGNLAFAARRQVGGQTATILGVVLGQVNRPAAFDATRRALTSVASALQDTRVISSGQPVATLKPAWGDAVDVVAAEDVQMLLWPGATLQASVQLDAVKTPLAAGDQVGWLDLQLGEQQRRVPLTVAAAMPKAGLGWRLTRI